MRPFGEFFEMMLNSCSAFLGGNNNDFFLFCFDTLYETRRTAIGRELDARTNDAKRIMSGELAKSLGINGPFAPDFPGLNTKKTDRCDGNSEAARQGWVRYRKMGYSDKAPTISPNMLIGTALILCLISTAQDALAEMDERCENKSFDNSELIAWLCKATEYNNASYIERVKTDAQYLLPFLLSTLFYCRKWQIDKEKPDFNIVFWLNSYFNACIHVSNDARLAEFQKEYYSKLWNASKKLDIRDMVSGAQLSSISENAQISNLYVIPPFLRNGQAVDCPIDDRSLFYYLVVADTGCGKSTFLNAIVTANIYEKVDALQIDSLAREAANRYQSIKERLGFLGCYFPILVKADSINHIEPEVLREKSILDFAVGSQCDSFKEWIEYTVTQQHDEKILLLADALDEIDGSDRKKLFGEMIEKFISDYPAVNVILTSRAIDFRDFHGCSFYDNLVRISLGQFGEEEIKELISKWIQCDISLAKNTKAKNTNIEEKYQYFHKNKYLSRLVSNPYMLSHVLHYQAHHTDATPQEIISCVIDNLIKKRWPVEKYDITAEYMREVLAYIAWDMAYENRHIIPSNGIVSWFSEASEKIAGEVKIDWSKVVKEMTARSGLIILEDIGYVFHNDVIEHYLAAEWIVSSYSNSWSQENNSEFFVLQKLQDVICDTIDVECWEDILTMMFSQYKTVRLEKLTPALLKFLMLKSTETMNKEEINVIGNVFINVVQRTFGKNHVTNDDYESGRRVRRQIVKFLCNNSHIIGDSWKKDKEFVEAYEFVKGNGIINQEAYTNE